VRTYAPAYASIVESLAGRVRYLYELATGQAAIPTDGVVTPLNPQGRVGIDRSGPPWGDALFHPLWIYEGTPVSSTIYGERAIASLSGTGDRARVIAQLQVRPFQDRPLAPYSLGELTIFGIRTGGASNAVATISTYPDKYDTGSARTTTLTMSSTTAMASAQVMIPLSPGYCERLITIESTASPAFSITHMAISQIKRRSH
jgi:hypothetical protein